MPRNVSCRASARVRRRPSTKTRPTASFVRTCLVPVAETILALAALIALVPVAAEFGDSRAFESGREATATVVSRTRTRGGGDDAAVADADVAGVDAFAPKTTDANAFETKDPSPSFAVYRMLGNDMWPLQGVGQIRRNAVFAARHEAAPPPDVPVFWVVNRVVDAAEREKLTSALAAEKNVSSEALLFAHPPLRDAKCLFARARENQTAGNRTVFDRAVTFAQAQNAVRNAAVAHARERGVDWAVPLDGNQFLPSDFYALLRDALREADADGRVAALIPMLRAREEQTSDAYHPRADTASVAARHVREDGKFAVSEPQIALHARNAEALGFRFEPSSAYGAGNKAGLLRRLCPAKSPNARGGTLAETPPRARCCELVDIKRRQQGSSYYYGGELDLSRVVPKTKGVKVGPDATDADRAELRRLVVRAAERMFAKCAVSVRLFNYAPEDGPSQLKIATSVLTRAKTRDEAVRIFREKLSAYLARTPEPEPETCAALDATRATLVTRDPETFFSDETGETETRLWETNVSTSEPQRLVLRGAAAAAASTRGAVRATDAAAKRGAPSASSARRIDPNGGGGWAFLSGVPFFGTAAVAVAAVVAARRRASRRRRGLPPSR